MTLYLPTFLTMCSLEHLNLLLCNCCCIIFMNLVCVLLVYIYQRLWHPQKVKINIGFCQIHCLSRDPSLFLVTNWRIQYHCWEQAGDGYCCGMLLSTFVVLSVAGYNKKIQMEGVIATSTLYNMSTTTLMILEGFQNLCTQASVVSGAALLAARYIFSWVRSLNTTVYVIWICP